MLIPFIISGMFFLWGCREEQHAAQTWACWDASITDVRFCFAKKKNKTKQKTTKRQLVSCVVLNMTMCEQNENHLRGADRLPAITPRCGKSIWRKRMMQLEVLNQRRVRSSVVLLNVECRKRLQTPAVAHSDSRHSSVDEWDGFSQKCPLLLLCLCMRGCTA